MLCTLIAILLTYARPIASQQEIAPGLDLSSESVGRIEGADEGGGFSSPLAEEVAAEGIVDRGLIPSLRTELVTLNLSQVGLGQSQVDLPFSSPVPTDGLFGVMWEAVVQQITNYAGTGNKTADVEFRLLSQGTEIAIVGRSGLFIGGGDWSSTLRSGQLALSLSGNVDAVRVVLVNGLDAGATGSIDSTARGMHSGNRVRIHFIYGAIEPAGPNAIRRFNSLPAISQVDSGVTAWNTYNMAPPLTLNGAKLIFPSGFGWSANAAQVSAMPELQLLLDDGSVLSLDDAFSPSTGAVPSASEDRTTASTSLWLTDQQRRILQNRTVTGWRWRVHVNGTGSFTYTPPSTFSIRAYYDPLPVTDLVGNSLVAPAAMTVGRQTSINWQVQNTGPDPTWVNSWSDDLILSDSPIPGAGNSRVLTSATIGGPVMGGATYDVVRTVTLAEGDEGQRYLFVRVDSSDAVLESEESNNWIGPVGITVSGAPDLVPTDLVAPSAAAAGQAIQLSWTVENRGESSAVAPWNDKVYLSTNQQYDASDTLLLTRSRNESLAVGSFYVANASATLPSATGTFWLIVRTDADNAVPESIREDNNTLVDDAPISVAQPPRPNLQITAITPPPNAPPGSVVQLAYTVTNTGNAPAQALWREVISGSLDGNIGGDFVLVSYLHDGAVLEPGASVQRLRDVTVPNVPPGGYWVVVCVDTDGVVVESNEGDNCAIGPVCVNCQSPDLMPVSIAGPANATAGSTVNISWSVRNIGTAAANGTWIDRIVLSSDTQIGNDTLVAEFQRSGPVASGATYIVTDVPITLPANVEGNLYFLVITDANNSISEPGGEGNNGIAASSPTAITLAAGPDLVIESVTAPTSGVFGQPLDLQWIGKNTGTAALNGAWSDRAFLSQTATLEGHDRPLQAFSAPVTSLAIDATYQGIGSVTLPLDASTVDGAYYILIQADSSNSISEQRETNNVRASAQINLVRPSLPDLQVSSITAPAPASVGQTVQVEYAIINGGATPLAGQWNEAIYASADGTIGSDMLLAVIAANDSLPPGEGVLRTQSVTVPNIGLQYRIVVCLDTTNTVLEGNENNNCAIAAQASTINRPDLQVTMLTPPVSAVADGQMQVSWTVTNTGSAPTLSTFVDAVALSTDNQIGNDLSIGSEVHLLQLLPGQFETFTRSFPVPGRIGGDHFVVVRADSGNQVLESDESNNSRIAATATNVVQPPRPNLIPEAVQSDNFSLSSGRGTVSWTVANIGPVPAAGTWTDRVVAVPVGGGTELVLASVIRNGPIESGAEYQAEAQVTYPAIAGDYQIGVIVDSADTVNEGLAGGEADNRFDNTVVLVVEGYDVTVLPSISTGLAGTPVTLTGRATRQSNGAPLANIPIRIAVRVRGVTRYLEATTDASGNYSTVFTPLPTEAGVYQLYSGPPGAISDVLRGTFTLHGMRAQQNLPSVRLYPGGQLFDGEFTLTNLGDLPLTGVTYNISGTVPGLLILPNMGPSTLAPQEVRRVRFTAVAPGGTAASTVVQFAFMCDQGPTATTGFGVEIRPREAQLDANPGSISTGMLRSTPSETRQSNYQFQLTNSGGTSTGPIDVLIPQVPWMALSTPATMPSLGPGESASVVLTLSPAADLPLGPYTGTIVVAAATTFRVIPYTITNVTDGIGDLQVIVEDEYTYYADGNPHVANALVTVSDPYTNSTIVSGLTNSDGELLFTSLPEGTYNIDVRANRHQAARRLGHVVRGETATSIVFAPAQVVTYSWRVDPIAIDDRYRFILEATFETNVPIPAITVDPPYVDLRSLIGTTTQINFTLTNHGLIAVENVRANFAGNGRFAMTPLVTAVDQLPAMSSITIPVIIEDVLADTNPLSNADPCGSVIMEFIHALRCGELRYYRTPIASSLPDEDCGGGTYTAPPTGGDGSPPPPGSPPNPHSNPPAPPSEQPPCGCYKVAVAFFVGDVRNYCDELLDLIGVCDLTIPLDQAGSYGRIARRARDIDPDQVAVRVFNTQFRARDQLQAAENWIASLNRPSCPRPKVIYFGSSAGGDTVVQSCNLGFDADVRIAVDPINRDNVLALPGFVCNPGARFNQRDCTFAGCVDFLYHATVLPCRIIPGGCDQITFEECAEGSETIGCLFGHNVPGVTPIPLPGRHHFNINDDPLLDVRVDDEVRRLLAE